MERRTGPLETMDVNPDFWRGKSVFLTGHTGFKGGWLALWLRLLGARVSGYALSPPTTPSLFDVAGVQKTMVASTIADIRDADALRDALNRSEAEIVFHLAAQPLVRLSYAAPVDTYAINVMGTVHLLDALRTLPSLRAAVLITSDKCYENREWPWGYRENEAMGGHDPYASSKGCAELIVSAYRRSFFSNGLAGIASARAGNVIGGGDWAADRLIPDLVRSFTAGRPITLRHPEAIRPWQHVLEPLAGYLLLAERLAEIGSIGINDRGEGGYAGGWNFGPADRDARTVRDVVDTACIHWGCGASWHTEPAATTPPQVHEARLLKLDSTLARERLGWKTRLDLPQALGWTLDWYRAQHAGDDMYACTMAQIERYQELSA